jgi:hypothetical protein
MDNSWRDYSSNSINGSTRINRSDMTKIVLGMQHYHYYYLIDAKA